MADRQGWRGGGPAPEVRSRAGRRRRRALLLVPVALVAAALLVGLLGWQRAGEAPPGADVASTAPGGPRTLTDAEAATLGAQLASPDQATVSSALSTEAGAALGAAPTAVVPEGSVVTIDAGTFTPGEDGHGTVRASVTGPSSGAFLLLLVLEGDQWRVDQTVAP